MSTDAAVISGRSRRAARRSSATAGRRARSRPRCPDARIFSRRGEWPPGVADADLVVNATPVRDEVLSSWRRARRSSTCRIRETATAAAARARGREVIDGLEVLVAQGAASFELWTGVPAPVDVMRAAVRRLV